VMADVDRLHDCIPSWRGWAKLADPPGRRRRLGAPARFRARCGVPRRAEPIALQARPEPSGMIAPMLRAHLSWLTGLVCALGTTTGPAAHDDALAQCLASCDQAGSETDQATCRLTCQEEDWAPKEPNITRWKKTELLG